MGLKRLLLIVDVQNDFAHPNGTLVAGVGEKPIEKINMLIGLNFDFIVKSRDWHTADHSSFNSNGGTWPTHCVKHTWGAGFCEKMATTNLEIVISKGCLQGSDSPSAFGNDGKENWKEDTGLANLVKSLSIDEVWICGYVTEVCVKATVLDALKLTKANVVVVEEACAPLDLKSHTCVLEELRQAGATVLPIDKAMESFSS